MCYSGFHGLGIGQRHARVFERRANQRRIPADQRIPDYQNVIAGSFVAENNS